MAAKWPFEDPPNVAVFTVRRILEGGRPIIHVCHDDEDGAWQFHDGGPPTMDQAMIVSLHCMLNHDPTIAELADLPCGWEAKRTGPGKPWKRAQQARSED
jgi:hypothetical protein